MSQMIFKKKKNPVMIIEELNIEKKNNKINIDIYFI